MADKRSVASRPTSKEAIRPAPKTPGVMADYAQLALDLAAAHEDVRLTRLALIGAIHEIDVVPAAERTVEVLQAFTEPVSDALERLYQTTASLSERSMALGTRLRGLICTVKVK